MTQMTQTRDKIIKMLKDRGCRMTKQRRILLDIILEDNCSSCKEIYYRASKKDKSIGTATVYRAQCTGGNWRGYKKKYNRSKSG